MPRGRGDGGRVGRGGASGRHGGRSRAGPGVLAMMMGAGTHGDGRAKRGGGGFVIGGSLSAWERESGQQPGNCPSEESTEILVRSGHGFGKDQNDRGHSRSWVGDGDVARLREMEKGQGGEMLRPDSGGKRLAGEVDDGTNEVIDNECRREWGERRSGCLKKESDPLKAAEPAAATSERRGQAGYGPDVVMKDSDGCAVVDMDEEKQVAKKEAVPYDIHPASDCVSDADLDPGGERRGIGCELGGGSAKHNNTVDEADENLEDRSGISQRGPVDDEQNKGPRADDGDGDGICGPEVIMRGDDGSAAVVMDKEEQAMNPSILYDLHFVDHVEDDERPGLGYVIGKCEASVAQDSESDEMLARHEGRTIGVMKRVRTASRRERHIVIKGLSVNRSSKRRLKMKSGRYPKDVKEVKQEEEEEGMMKKAGRYAKDVKEVKQEEEEEGMMKKAGRYPKDVKEVKQEEEEGMMISQSDTKDNVVDGLERISKRDPSRNDATELRDGPLFIGGLRIYTGRKAFNGKKVKMRAGRYSAVRNKEKEGEDDATIGLSGEEEEDGVISCGNGSDGDSGSSTEDDVDKALDDYLMNMEDGLDDEDLFKRRTSRVDRGISCSSSSSSGSSSNGREGERGRGKRKGKRGGVRVARKPFGGVSVKSRWRNGEQLERCFAGKMMLDDDTDVDEDEDDAEEMGCGLDFLPVPEIPGWEKKKKSKKSGGKVKKRGQRKSAGEKGGGGGGEAGGAFPEPPGWYDEYLKHCPPVGGTSGGGETSRRRKGKEETVLGGEERRSGKRGGAKGPDGKKKMRKEKMRAKRALRSLGSQGPLTRKVINEALYRMVSAGICKYSIKAETDSQKVSILRLSVFYGLNVAVRGFGEKTVVDVERTKYTGLPHGVQLKQLLEELKKGGVGGLNEGGTVGKRHVDSLSAVCAAAANKAAYANRPAQVTEKFSLGSKKGDTVRKRNRDTVGKQHVRNVSAADAAAREAADAKRCAEVTDKFSLYLMKLRTSEPKTRRKRTGGGCDKGVGRGKKAVSARQRRETGKTGKTGKTGGPIKFVSGGLIQEEDEEEDDELDEEEEEEKEEKDEEEVVGVINVEERPVALQDVESKRPTGSGGPTKSTTRARLGGFGSKGDEGRLRHLEKEFGSFEAHTTGFGSRMLAKMGFVGVGKGLGKDGSGMAEPIEAVMRPRNLGLGAN